MTKLFAEPSKDENGTWAEPLLGKLLRECRAAPAGFLATLGWLTLLKLLGQSLVPKDKNVTLATLFDGQPLGRLHASLVGDFKPPVGTVLDDEGELVEEVDDPFSSEGKVTKINIAALPAHVEALCESAQKMLDAGLLEIAPGVKLELKSK